MRDDIGKTAVLFREVRASYKREEKRKKENKKNNSFHACLIDLEMAMESNIRNQ
jgi:hypothetical protein